MTIKKLKDNCFHIYGKNANSYFQTNSVYKFFQTLEALINFIENVNKDLPLFSFTENAYLESTKNIFIKFGLIW